MPKFAANLSFLFNEYDFLDKFNYASKAGFKGVEYVSPYEYDKHQLVDILGSNDLKQVLFNLPAGDWANGERGIGCLPDRVSEFQEGVGIALEYALALGCERVNCLAGIKPDDLSEEEANETMISNLEYAGHILDRSNVKLLVESINTIDIPGFFLNTSDQAARMLGELDCDNVSLQHDLYHMQIMEGDLARTLRRHAEIISHVQLADNPGRHEPGTGEINYPFLFSVLDEIGYTGWVGCEYIPAGKTMDGLSWMESYL